MTELWDALVRQVKSYKPGAGIVVAVEAILEGRAEIERLRASLAEVERDRDEAIVAINWHNNMHEKLANNLADVRRERDELLADDQMAAKVRRQENEHLRAEVDRLHGEIVRLQSWRKLDREAIDRKNHAADQLGDKIEAVEQQRDEALARHGMIASDLESSRERLAKTERDRDEARAEIEQRKLAFNRMYAAGR